MKRLLCLALLCLMALLAVQAVTQSAGEDLPQTTAPATGTYRRIVSLYPGHTENLFALGLSEAIVGVSEHETFPPAALAKPAFSPRDDAEKLLAAGPDLILARPMLVRGHPGLFRQLDAAGIKTVSLQPASFDEIFPYWRELGRLTGKQAEAEAMIADFSQSLAAIRGRLAAIPQEKRVRVYFESIHRQMKTFAPHAIAIFALEAAGGVNAAPDALQVRDTNIADYGQERILARGDAIDVYLSQQGPMNRIDAAAIAAVGGFQAIKAVRQGRVYVIDEDIVSRPTPRLLEGIDSMARLFYPELFAGEDKPTASRYENAARPKSEN